MYKIVDLKTTKPFVLLICVVCLIGFSFPTSSEELKNGFSGQTSIAIGSNSNVFGLTSSAESDTVLEVNPELKYSTEFGKHFFSARYQGSFNRFNNFNNLNYGEHKTRLQGTIEHTLRFRSEINLSYQKLIELPGLNDSITESLQEYNALDNTLFSYKAILGTNKSIGQVVVQVMNDKRDYKNNGQDFRDFDANKLLTTFFYRITSNTRLVFEASRSNLDYDNSLNNPSSTYTNYLTGAEWRPTVKTRGVIKIGKQTQKFDNELFNDISGLAFFADIFWRPNTYSLLQIGASRTTRESSESNIGGFVATEFLVSAEHEFTPRLSTKLSYRYGDDDVVFGSNLKLNRHQLDFKILFSMNRSIDVFFGIESLARNSNEEVYEFNADKFTLGVFGYL